MYADNVPPLQAIDPRLPQVAPLDARMFQVCKGGGLFWGGYTKI